MLVIHKSLWKVLCIIAIITISIFAIRSSTAPFFLQLFPLFKFEWYDRHNYSSKTGISGVLFKGDVIRKFPTDLSRYMNLTQRELEKLTKSHKSNFSYKKPKVCDNWVVVTTIFPPSESVKKAAGLDGWCLVVVADKKSSLSYDLDNIVYLTVNDQQKLTNHYNFIHQIPWNHFGRKNIGYFYAMLHEPEYIFDLDDDNVLKQQHIIVPKTVMQISAPNCTVFNVYPNMNASVIPTWPRGFPLEDIKKICNFSLESRGVHKEELVLFQSLADEDPDVDAIYRMTLNLPFHFKAQIALQIPAGIFVPYNAQASLHFKKSFWGLILPVTVTGRVADIWRSYFTQRILWEIGCRIAFVPSFVDQFRNPHRYFKDFEDEMDLYRKTGALVHFLGHWKARTTTLPGLIEELWIELYERNYIEKEDVELLQSWLDALVHIGYNFSRIIPYSSRSKKNRNH